MGTSVLNSVHILLQYIIYKIYTSNSYLFYPSLTVEASSQASGPSTTGAPGTPGTQATLLREPLRSAIHLQPPYQTTPHRPDRAPRSGSQSPPANGLGSGAAVEQEAPAGTSEVCPSSQIYPC